MKYSTTLPFLALLGLSHAYPNIMAHLEAAGVKSEPLSAPLELNKRQTVGFDAAAQYVSTTGANAFNPPGSDDQRGPCPGLNAMANHGYMPHNGIGTIEDFITGTGKVFGMGMLS